MVDAQSEEARPDPRWSEGLIHRHGLVYGVAVSTLAMLRVTIPGGLAVVWADDGVLIAASRWMSPWDAVSFPYQGYLNVGPMLVAMTLEWLPVSLIPVGLVIAWAASVGSLAVLVARVSRSFLDRSSSRAMLGAALGLTPIASFESLGSIANLQWLLVAAAIVILVGEPVGRGEAVASGVVLALAAMSAPAAVALIPFALWRHRRRWHLVAFLTGITLQVITVATQWGARDTAGDWFAVWDVASTFMWSGLNSITSARWRPFSPNYLTVLLIGVIGVAAWKQPRRFAPIAVIVAAGFAVWWFTYGGAGATPARPRYMVVPAVCFVAAVMRATERVARLHLVVIAVVCVTWVVGFQASALRTEARSWKHQVEQAECVEGEMLIGLAPQGFGLAVLPCG
jgi:hypothetical protein